MPITFICPHCQCKMTVPDALAGKRGKCSKCKCVLTVPADTNGSSIPPPPPASAPAAPRTNTGPPPIKGPASPSAGLPGNGASHTAGPAARPKGPSPKAALPPPTAAELEAEAMKVLADEQVGEAPKVLTALEFECPMCFEPVKLALDLGGKKHPCPHCKRIITVPMPRPEQRTTWRDAGPKLPSAARRPDEPAPEGAWGSTNVAAASRDGLLEAGVIQAKRKPLTLLQKMSPYLLVGVPVLLLLAGTIAVYSWLARNKEKQALEFALTFAEAEKSPAAVGLEGVAALHGNAALYYLRGNRSGSPALSRDQLSRAVALASTSRNPERDALLLDLSKLPLDLAGTDQQVEFDLRLKWDDAQKLLRATLAAIDSPEARLEGLRRACAGLVEHGQDQRVLPLASTLYPAGSEVERCEALGVVGLELLRLGKKDEAIKVAKLAEDPYAKTKDAPKSLRSSVVALAVALDHKPPQPGKGLVEEENSFIGTVEGLARAGKLADARKLIAEKHVFPATQLRALVALAAGAPSTQVDVEDFNRALQLAPDGAKRPWVLLRLIDAGLAANVPSDKLERAAAGHPLAGWGRLLLLRSQLAASRSQESLDVLQPFPANSLAGRVARLELSRHNTHLDSGWDNTVKNWEGDARAFGSMGVALGMQKDK